MNPSRSIKVIAGLVTMLVLVGAPPGDAAPFVAGDVFVNGSGGIHHFSSSLSLKDTYVPDKSYGASFGLAFGPSGDLFIAQFTGDPPPYGTGPTVRRLSHKDGSELAPFGSGYSGGPHSLVFDNAGSLYVGGCCTYVRKFAPWGPFLAEFTPLDLKGPGWIWEDLAADQKTLFYTTGGPAIGRYDLSKSLQMSSFAVLHTRTLHDVRLLPDGGLLVAAWDEILRLDAEGTVIQKYDILSEDSWYVLTLDPEGKSFWGGGFESDTIYKFDIATGILITGTVADPTDGPSAILGLAVFPGLRRTRGDGFQLAALDATTLDLQVSAPATLFLLTAGLLVAGLGHARRRTQGSSPPGR